MYSLRTGGRFIVLLNIPGLPSGWEDIYTLRHISFGTLDKGSYMKVNQPRGLWKTFLNTCLLFSLAFFFVCKFLPAETHAGGLTNGSHYTNAFSWGHAGHFYRNPFNPKETGPAWESLFESEDYNLKLGGWICPPIRDAVVPPVSVADKTLSALPPPFIHNRARVPLFVLYHSWKTFLH